MLFYAGILNTQMNKQINTAINIAQVYNLGALMGNSGCKLFSHLECLLMQGPQK